MLTMVVSVVLYSRSKHKSKKLKKEFKMKQEDTTEFDKIKATIDDLELGKVALFGFKPGGGKSTLLTNLIYNYVMQDGNNILHVTLEDLNPEYISKLQSYYHNLANIGG